MNSRIFLIFAKLARRTKARISLCAQREYQLFSKSRFNISFKPFFVFQGVFVFAIAFLYFLALGSILIPKPQIDQSKLVKASQTRQTTAVVAGRTTKVTWSVIVKRSDITKQNQYLKLPKNAKNIKVTTISKQAANKVLADTTFKNPQTKLAQKDRLALAGISQSNANFLAMLTTSIVADVEQATADAVQTVTDQLTQTPADQPPTTQTQDSTAVDLSGQAQAPQESSTTQTPSATQPTTEAPSVPATPSAEPATASDTTMTDESTIAASEQTQTQTETPATSTEDYVQVDYTTKAPTITEQTTDTGKIVTVAAPDETPTPSSTSDTNQTPASTPMTDVLAHTNIPKIYKVGQEDKIKIKWKNNGNQEVTFHAYDLDNDGYLDYVEWTVPHLSEQIFEIIFTSKAFELDQQQNIVADIYDQTKTKDDNWATISSTHYVRATFQFTLDNTNDVTIYAKPTDSNNPATIEVYPVYTDQDGNQTDGQLIATFPPIDSENTYKILLKNLQTPTDVFDLKITGSVDFDYIVDPTTNTWIGGTDLNCSTDANWSTGLKPIETDDVIINATADAIAWDAGCPSTVNSLTLDTGFTGTVTLAGNITTTGSITINAGTLQTAKDATSNVTTGTDFDIGTGGTVVVRRSSITANVETINGNPVATGAGQTITVGGNLTITGNMNADGQGFDSGTGPGFCSQGYSWGASYGGRYYNGHSDDCPTYGDMENPVSLGSGNIYSFGGGGAIRISCAGTLSVSGVLSADGGGNNGAGGPTGGSINISANVLAGTGRISANGDPGAGSYNQPGGGGRMSFHGVTTNNFSGTLTANGGSDSLTTGTIYLDAASRANLIIGGTGHLASLRLGSDGTNDYTFGSITINSGGVLTIDGNAAMNFPFGGAATINADSLDVESGGILNADGLGFPGGHRIGGSDSNPTGYGSGCYGGWAPGQYGGTNCSPYGSITNPINIGSGGDYGGGGAIILNITGEAIVNGTISANSEMEPAYGVGAGGTVNLTTGSLSGNGSILADSDDWISGDPYYLLWPQYTRSGGSGGRVSVVLTDGNDFGSITMHAWGGISSNNVSYYSDNSENGAAGTVYKETESQGAGKGDLIIDNKGVNPPDWATTWQTGTGGDGTGIKTADDIYTDLLGASVTDVPTGNIILQNSGKIGVASGKTMTVSGLTMAGAGALSNAGTITVQGDVIATSGENFINNGTLTFQGGVTASAGTTFTNNGTLNFAAASNVNNSPFTNSGIATFQGDLTAGSGTNFKNTGTLNFAGSNSFDNTVLISSGNNSNVHYSGSSGVMAGGYYDVSVNHSGNIFTTAGDTTVADALTIGSSTTFRVGAHTNVSFTGSGTPIINNGGTFDATTNQPNTVLYGGSSTVNVEPGSYSNLALGTQAHSKFIGDPLQFGDSNGLESAAVDTINNVAYFATNTWGGGPDKIVKVDLSDFSIKGVLDLGDGKGLGPDALAIDSANHFLYAGTYESPASVLRIHLSDSDFSSATVDTLPIPDATDLEGAGIDTVHGFLFFGNDDTQGLILKVDLQSFSEAGVLPMNEGVRWFENPILIDSAHDTGYALSEGSSNYGTQSHVISFSLSGFQPTGDVILSDSGGPYLTGAIDVSHRALYIGGYKSPQDSIYKLNLDNFDSSGISTLKLTVEDGVAMPMAIDTAGEYLYVGTYNFNAQTSKVIEINLSDFSRISDLPIPGVNRLGSAVTDASANVYFGTDINNWPNIFTSDNYIYKIAGKISSIFTLGTGGGQTLTVNGDMTIGGGDIAEADATTYNPDIHIQGNVINAENSTFIAPLILTVNGNWNNAGTFSPGSGTVNFVGTAQTISGNTAFNNFVMSAPNALTFANGTTQTITGDFTCQGSAGNTIRMQSDSPGALFTLSKDSGTVDCDYLSVKDSATTGGATWNPGSHSTNISGNSGWTFPARNGSVSVSGGNKYLQTIISNLFPTPPVQNQPTQNSSNESTLSQLGQQLSNLFSQVNNLNKNVAPKPVVVNKPNQTQQSTKKPAPKDNSLVQGLSQIKSIADKTKKTGTADLYSLLITGAIIIAKFTGVI